MQVSEDFRYHQNDKQCAVCQFMRLDKKLGAICGTQSIRSGEPVAVDRFAIRNDCNEFLKAVR